MSYEYRARPVTLSGPSSRFTGVLITLNCAGHRYLSRGIGDAGHARGEAADARRLQEVAPADAESLGFLAVVFRSHEGSPLNVEWKNEIGEVYSVRKDCNGVR